MEMPSSPNFTTIIFIAIVYLAAVAVVAALLYKYAHPRDDDYYQVKERNAR